MRKGLRFGLAALVLVVSLAVAVGASGAPQRVAPTAVAHAADLGPSCYPSHEFTIFDSIGAFTASSTGSAVGPLPGADVSFSTSVKVTGNKSNVSGFFPNRGSLAGNLTATVHVPGVAHTIHFMSHCITAAFFTAGLYVVAEGVVDLQPWQPGDNEAIVTLFVDSGNRVGPQAGSLVGFSIAHAKTCDSLPGQQYSYAFSDTDAAVTSLSKHFKGMGASSRGRTGLPAGVTPSLSPCPGLSFD